MQRHSRAYLAPFSGTLMDFLDGLAAGLAAGKQLLPLQGGAAEGARSERLARLRPGCHLFSTTGRSSAHRDVIRLRIAKKVSRTPAASTPEAAPNESEKPPAAATGGVAPVEWSSCVRATARETSTARPRALPTCWAVVNMPLARPASPSPVIAVIVTATKVAPAPTGATSIPGKRSTRYEPFAEMPESSASPAAATSRPPMMTIQAPSRAVNREPAPKPTKNVAHKGRYASPAESGE